MVTQMKQRIVGGIVIICVLAIFLPILLHKPKTEKLQQVPMAIPKPTTVSEMSLQLPVQNGQQQAQDNTVATSTTATTPAQAVTTPAQKLAVAEQAVVRPTAVAQPTTVHSAHKEAPVVDHSINSRILQSAISTPQAWVVQLASFANQANASKLVAQLRQKGFQAYTRTSHFNRHSITRVFVGPEINQNKIQQVKQNLNKQFHLSGVVRKYTV
jgi:DedD protein